MHAVILAGGRGSRLRPFTFAIPKPLVPIGDAPIIELLIRQLGAQGFTRITISVGHMAALIRSFCGDGEQWGVPIDYIYEEEPLGTVGSLGLVEHFEDDRVLVVNGDTLTDMDFSAAYREHSIDDAATICANTRTVDVDFGVLDTEDGYLTGYTEKPRLRYLVSMGTNVLTVAALVGFVTPGVRLDMPELIEAFRDDGRRVRVRDDGAYWLDLGRLDDLEEGTRIFTEHPERFLRS
jgi:NDP-mannose synthase